LSKQITNEEYLSFSNFLENACGITLGENKEYLVSSRLQRLMDDESIENISALVKQLNNGSNMRLRSRIVDAMTTNETLWFRDNNPYETLRKELLPELAKERNRPLRIWSAACSSGQEPYSISMIIHEFMAANPGGLPRGVEIVATDISQTILSQAKKGHYDDLAIVRGVSAERKQRYFKKVDKHWEIIPDIRKRVRFVELNLMQSYISLGLFDIVFCRNVLIYFSSDLKRDIIGRMSKGLRSRGILFLGTSESITGHSDDFDMVRCLGGVHYRKKQ